MGNTLFDLFTGQPAIDAANQSRNYLASVQTQGNQTLDAATLAALGNVTGGTAGARSDILGNTNSAAGALTNNAASAQGYLAAGNAGALGQLGNAGAAYNPLDALGQKYGAGTSLYLDSLGVNGAAGNQNAAQAFQAGPGYDFQMTQGLDAINRSNNAKGILTGGNVDQAAQTYGQGLANQTYGNWQAQLAGLINPELSATTTSATGRAGLDQTAAGLLNSNGIAGAGVATGLGAGLAGLYGNQGSSLAGLTAGEGNSLAGINQNNANAKVGLATNIASPYANTYNQEANAQMQGSANLWGLGLNLARLGTTAAGGGGLASLGNFFGGGPAAGASGPQAGLGAIR